MKTRYEKHGSTVRIESSLRGRASLELSEQGWAETDDDGSFSCGPLDVGPTANAHVDSRGIETLEAAVRQAVSRGLVIERLTVASGHANHSFTKGRTSRTWSESVTRVFLSLIRHDLPIRTTITLGASEPGGMNIDPVPVISRTMAAPLATWEGETRSIGVAPWITASLWRALADFEIMPVAASFRLMQAPDSEVRDGEGRKPKRRIVRPSDRTWPESFRPSYRFAPTHAPLHLDAAPVKTSAETSASIVVKALLGKWDLNSSLLIAPVLVSGESDPRSRTAYFVVDAAKIADSIAALGDRRMWFPEGGGSWGRELILRSPAARLRSAPLPHR